MNSRTLALLAALWFGLEPTAAFAQSKAPGPDWEAAKSALQQKYRIDEISIEPTDDGAAGSVLIVGRLTPASMAAARGSAPADRARHVAAAFFREDNVLLGAAGRSGEMRERSQSVDAREQIHLSYDLYVAGLRVPEVDLGVHVDANGEIVAVNGRAHPLDEATVAAITKASQADHLPQAALAALVQANLAAREGLGGVVLGESELVALVADPWVAWSVVARVPAAKRQWNYRLDAVTGAVLESSELVVSGVAE